MNHDPSPFRLRHFLIPQALLASGDAADNPLLQEAERRLRRPWDKFLASLLELALALLFILMLGSEIFSLEEFQFRVTKFYQYNLYDILSFYLYWGPGALLLLRYNLFASGASQHLASLHRERLRELRLTRLNRDDFLLHQLVRLLQRRRAIYLYVCAILVCLLAGIQYSHSSNRWSGISAYQVIHLSFFIVYKSIGYIIGLQVGDVLDEARRALREERIETLDDVRRRPGRLVQFSAAMREQNAQLRDFLYRRVYRSPFVVRMATKAERFVTELFNLYEEVPELLPLKHQERAKEENLKHVIRDYLSGMTDRYLQEEYIRVFEPQVLTKF